MTLDELDAAALGVRPLSAIDGRKQVPDMPVGFRWVLAGEPITPDCKVFIHDMPGAKRACCACYSGCMQGSGRCNIYFKIRPTATRRFWRITMLYDPLQHAPMPTGWEELSDGEVVVRPGDLWGGMKFQKSPGWLPMPARYIGYRYGNMSGCAIRNFGPDCRPLHEDFGG